MAQKAGSLLLHQLRFVVASWREDTRTDAELLRRFAQKRDEQAFCTLVGRHGDLVWGVCLRVLRNTADAEDALQATFLRLARDADRVEARGALAGWLHRVARACAVDLHRSIARQRRIEGRLAGVASQGGGEAQPADLRVLLDDELSQLPTCERAVLVLICLEGRTYAEAATELGCSTAAVHRRYQHAQARLRQRLARHGPAAVGMIAGGAPALAPPAASAAPPLVLARTVEAGLGVARSGVLPASRAGLLAAGAGGVALGRAVAAAVLVGTALAAAGLALALPRREPPPQPPAPAAVPPPAAPAAERPRPRDEVSGVVRGADGKPVAGAEVVALARRPFAPGQRGLRDEVVARATTGGDGRFALRVADDFATWFADRVVTVRASAPGLAPDSVPVRVEGSGDVELRLAGGAALRGRLVLGSGEPAAGAKVEVVRVGCAVSEPVVGAEWDHPPGWPEPVRADADGRFAIPRLGAAENVWVRVADPRFATDTFRLDRSGGGGDAAYQLEPAVPLTVEVRAAEDGRPVAGAHVTVVTDRLRSHAHFCAADHAILGALTVPADIDAVTGPDGTVRVEVARGDRVELLVHPPAGDEPLVGVRQAVEAGDAPALAPVVRLPRGRWLTGTVTDAAGRGVAGAAVHWGREGAAKPEWRDDVLVGRDALTRTDAGGRFRLAVLPGACSVRAHGPTLNHPPVAARVPGSGTTLFAHQVTRIDVPASGDLAPVALALPAAATAAGAAEGAGASAFQLCSGRSSPVRPYASLALPVRDGRFAVPGCRPGWVTRVYLLDPVAKLGAVADVSPGNPVPPVKLAPCGAVRVRVLGPDGLPAAGREVTVSLLATRDRRPGEPPAADPQPTDWFDAANYPARPKTDAAGVAELAALIPGAEYRLAVSSGAAKTVVGTFTIEPGRTLVLPDVVPTEGETP